VKKWWIGKTHGGWGSVTEVIAPDCGFCSDAIRDVYLKLKYDIPQARELPYEELCMMRVMLS